MSAATSRIARRHGIRAIETDRIGIGHVLVDNCSFEEAAGAIILHAATDGEPAYVITPNAQHVVLLDKELRLREIYQSADLVIPDGISIVLAARLFGRQLKERVPGVDLFQRLCGLAAQHNLRVFLLGGRPGSAELTAGQLAARFPNLQIQSYCPPVGFENDPVETQRTEDAVLAARPHLLFVAFGAPKQEYWIFDHGRKLGVNVCVGVGGTFEMVGGIVRRAPRWIQNLGCEWLYRFYLEPRRMWRRYLIGNFQFCKIIFLQWFRMLMLSSLTRLLQKQTFAAELLEPALRGRCLQLASKLNSVSRGE